MKGSEWRNNSIYRKDQEIISIRSIINIIEELKIPIAEKSDKISIIIIQQSLNINNS